MECCLSGQHAQEFGTYKNHARPTCSPVRGSANVCVVCVCVFFPFIRDMKFVGRTSRGHTGGRSHRIFRPPFLDFSREKDSAIPFPRRP